MIYLVWQFVAVGLFGWSVVVAIAVASHPSTCIKLSQRKTGPENCLCCGLRFETTDCEQVVVLAMSCTLK